MSILNCFSHNKKYYFIASVRDTLQEVPDELKKLKNLPDDYKYENHDSRCWGFFMSKRKAIHAVTENWTDMNEAGYYKYVVIEPHYEGLLNPIPNEDIWFRAVYNKQKICLGYKECERPDWAIDTVGWAIS
jgi:hypothetical protein